MVRLLEGKPLALKIQEGLKQQVSSFNKKLILAAVQVGDNPSSKAYVRNQQKTAENLGITYQLHQLPVDTTESVLISLIEKINSDKSVNGLIIQMPLPGHIDYKKIRDVILPEKDIEGVHPQNLGKMILGTRDVIGARIIPCTPASVMELLNSTGIDLAGKEVVIVGRSVIVGKPLLLLLLEKSATVTVCHSGTSKAGKLEEHIKKAEVLIVAMGKPEFIKGSLIKEGAIVIDVGINQVNERIVGDVEFEAAKNKASWITPVPGGVGPLTVTMLMRNLIEAAKLQ